MIPPMTKLWEKPWQTYYSYQKNNFVNELQPTTTNQVTCFVIVQIFLDLTVDNYLTLLTIGPLFRLKPIKEPHLYSFSFILFTYIRARDITTDEKRCFLSQKKSKSWFAVCCFMGLKSTLSQAWLQTSVTCFNKPQSCINTQEETRSRKG